MVALLSFVAIGCNNQAASNNVIKIATHTALSGGNATLGEAIKLGAQLALEEHQAEFEKLGFKLELVPFDDQADPKKGVANAQQLAADQNIFGIVGHLNSGVTQATAPTYEKNKIVLVSPANTAVTLTESGWKTVHRIVARDDFQGPAAAQYAVNTLNAKNIFIIQDKTAYGQGLAENFKKEAEKLGVTISGYEGITIGEKDFNGVLNQVLNKKPDLIYFGGLYSEGGILTKQAREKGINVPILGGDGLDSSDMIKIAGTNTRHTYYTTVAADASKTPEGQKFVEKYKQKFNKSPESYSFYGYDSMQVILKGLKDAVDQNGGKKPTREQVLNAVHNVQDFQGVATRVGFDEKGDNKFAKVFIFKFENQKYPGTEVSVIEKK
nr:branched-chain amino acid ABC transporter substrate-binding protein [Risungbinella massiliensis]